MSTPHSHCGGHLAVWHRRRTLPVTIGAGVTLAIYLALAVPALIGAYMVGGLDAITSPQSFPDLLLHTKLTSWLRGWIIPSALIGLSTGAIAIAIERRARTHSAAPETTAAERALP